MIYADHPISVSERSIIMQLMPVWRTNTRNPLNREGCRCYTVDEIMMIMGVGRKAVYSLIRKIVFPSIRISSIGYRIPKDTFEAWLHQKQCG
jgi:excisionase family DNA binding protein